MGQMAQSGHTADRAAGPAPSPAGAKRVPFDRIYEAIRDRICLLDYPPGTVLREGALAAEFGVSRTPIREVLHRLAFDGLVEARNGVGTIVTSVDHALYKDIYAMRLKVAEMIGELSPQPCSEADVRAVERLLEQAETLKDRYDPKAYWSLNHDLHLIVGGLIGNRALRTLWDRYYFQVARIWYALVPDAWEALADDFCAELTDVLRALRENDMRALGFTQRNHIAVGMRRVMAHLERARS
jgi:DNA-binding GntR family transcriptional regulator